MNDRAKTYLLTGLLSGLCIQAKAIDRTPKALASDQVGPSALAGDEENLFWTTEDGRLMKVSKHGGEVVKLGEGAKAGCAIALDEHNVYWYVGVELMKTPKNGGNAEVVLGELADPTGLAVHGATVYGSDTMLGAVFRYKLGNPKGAPMEQLAANMRAPTSLALDDESLYWVNHEGGTVMKLSQDGSHERVILADHQNGPWFIAVDKEWVYWTNNEGGSVMKVRKTGGDLVTIAKDQPKPYGIAVDEANVYWGTFGGTVMRGSKAGGPPEELARGPFFVWSVMTDAKNIYWTELAVGEFGHPDLKKGAVMQLPKSW